LQGSPIQQHHGGAAGDVSRSRQAAHPAAERQPYSTAGHGRVRGRAKSTGTLLVQKSNRAHRSGRVRGAAAARAALSASQPPAGDTPRHVQQSAGAGASIPAQQQAASAAGRRVRQRRSHDTAAS